MLSCLTWYLPLRLCSLKTRIKATTTVTTAKVPNTAKMPGTKWEFGAVQRKR